MFHLTKCRIRIGNKNILKIDADIFINNETQFISLQLLIDFFQTQHLSYEVHPTSQFKNEVFTYSLSRIINVHVRTVDGFRKSLFSKLNIKSKTGLVMFAIKNKLV